MPFKKPIFILLLIILLALIFRLPAVLNSGSFWFDEVVSLEIAKQPIVNSWQYLKWENNPPLHYWFLHFWIKFFGQSEIALKLSSVLFSLLALIAIYFLGRRLVSPQVGLMASFLAAISSYQLFSATDARMYPMLLFFAVLSCYYFYQSLNQPKKLNWLLYTLFTLLAFYTHLTGFFLFISHNLYFIYHHHFIKKNQPTLLSWTLNQLIILGLFSPWLITFILRSLSNFNSGAWYLHTQGGGFLPLEISRSFIFLGDKFPFIELVGLIIFGSLFVLSLSKIHSWQLASQEFKVQLQLTPQVIFLLTLFIIPLLAGFLVQLWVTKYYIVSSIGLYLIVAIGLSNFQLKHNFKAILIVLIFTLLVPYNLNLIQNNQHSWDQVADYVKAIERPDDKILISAFVYRVIFEHYYRGNLEVTGYEPLGLEGDLLLKTVKYNWYPILSADNMPDPNQILAGANRAIVINPSMVTLVHKTNLVLDWFIEHDWHLEHREQFGGFVQPTVFIFDKPNQE